jgi:hypothetical protein
MCLPRPLDADADGRTAHSANTANTAISVVEMMPGPCDCSRPARAASPRDEIEAIYQELRAAQVCGESTGIPCSDYCGCRILELAGSSSDPASPLYACQNHTTVSDASIVGYCYIAPNRVDENGAPAPIGNPELAAICDPTQYQRLRFVGADTPFPGAHVFVTATAARVP